MAELLTKADLRAVTADRDLSAVTAGLEAAMERLETRIETLVRQLTVRFGIMLAVGFGALAAFLKLT